LIANRASVGAIVLALLVGGFVLREGSRDQSRPPGDFENRNDVAVHEETRPSQPTSDTGSIVSETVISDRELRQLHTRIAQLETQIAQLEQRSRVLKNQQRALAEQGERLSENREPQGVTSGNNGTGDAVSEADADAIASEGAFVQERITALESELTSQATDPLWSPTAERHITSVFSNESLHGNTLANLGCAATLCWLEVMHIDEDSRDYFMDEILPSLGWKTESYSYTLDNNDGSFNTVLYLSREGYSLPSLSK
jgi:hypothetical protein